MNGYSKMRRPFNSPNPKSKNNSSSDSDLFSFSKSPKTNPIIIPDENKLDDYSPDHQMELQDDDMGRKAESPVMKSSSGNFSMNSYHGFRFSRQCSARSEKLSATVDTAVKKVLSMRRSSSVSERYCRMIYDEFLEVDGGLLVDDEEGNVGDTTTSSSSSKKKMKKMGNGVKIFKACKRLFGF